MNLVRLRIMPLGAWLTPWHADTLTGLLASTFARAHGGERLKRDLLDPWQAGEPPFVLSDAFPGDLLPAPACLPLWPWPEEKRKQVKRTEWLEPHQFQQLQEGQQPALAPAITKLAVEDVRLRNTLDRIADRTGAPGSLYEIPCTALGYDASYLSVYARLSTGGQSLLGGLLSLLAEAGFGADTSVGQGHFEWDGSFDDASWLAGVKAANGWISLSTFQPAQRDSTHGYWRSFVKYGKLGPDFGVDGVFKRPQWMLRPGSCFREQGTAREWYGRLIGTDELLPEGTRKELAVTGTRPVQPAYALAVPMKWAKEYEA